MNTHQTAGHGHEDAAGHAVTIPEHFTEVLEPRLRSADRRLGYMGSQRFVIFDFSVEGGEVLWRDGHSCGFGSGGWQLFLGELASHAAQLGATLSSHDAEGTHVFIVDRLHRAAYLALRQHAQDFLEGLYEYQRLAPRDVVKSCGGLLKIRRASPKVGKTAS